MASRNRSPNPECNARLEAALAYAARGWPVLPLRGKLPAIPKREGGRGVHDATDDLDTIRNWWRRIPDANIGIAMGEPSGVWALDIDPRHDGEASLRKLEHQHGALPQTVEQVTGAGGRHLLFQWQSDAIKNRANVAPGLDVRSTGGYIVAAPSKHPNTGRHYTWDVDCHPDDTTPAEAPGWLIRLVTERPGSGSRPAQAPQMTGQAGRNTGYGDKALVEECRTVAKAECGRRNDALNRAAFKLGQLIVGGMLNQSQVEGALFGAAATSGLVADDGKAAVLATIASGLTTGIENPREKPAHRTFKGKESLDAADEAPPLTEANKCGHTTVEGVHGARKPGNLSSPEFSDDQLALRFTEELGDELCYVHLWGRWLRWDGWRWSFDQTLSIFDRARTICRLAATECKKPKEQTAIASAKTVAAVERLARSDRRHAATVEQWDTHPWLLPTPAGEINLRIGEIGPSRPEHYMTKITAVAPGGDCPLWQLFLDRVTNGDKELQLYLQRAVGYCLTGSVEEEALFFLHGTGQNGKGVFIHTLAGIFGEFHTAAPMEMFLFSKHDRHPTELAGLRGARLVTCTEVEEGRRWDEAKIKALTGSDTICARFMRQDFFNFIPTFKLMISGNHKPSLSHVDKAISRRFHLISFTVTIPDDERDDTLAERLKGEWPGILQWAIDGAAEWALTGLAAPEAVREATHEYLSAQDSISLWIEECCVEAISKQETIAELWKSWRTWCDQSNDYPGKKLGFVEALLSRGYRRTRIGKAGAKGLAGIRLVRADELEIEPSQDPTH